MKKALRRGTAKKAKSKPRPTSQEILSQPLKDETLAVLCKKKMGSDVYPCFVVVVSDNPVEQRYQCQLLESSQNISTLIEKKELYIITSSCASKEGNKFRFGLDMTPLEGLLYERIITMPHGDRHYLIVSNFVAQFADLSDYNFRRYTVGVGAKRVTCTRTVTFANGTSIVVGIGASGPTGTGGGSASVAKTAASTLTRLRSWNSGMRTVPGTLAIPDGVNLVLIGMIDADSGVGDALGP